MHEPAPTRPASDRNLLFGILALQMDFITRDALIAAMSAWVLDKTKSLGEILQAQGALAEDERAALETLVDKHLRKHGGDPERSLAAVGSGGAVATVSEALHRLTDPDLTASLAHVRAPSVTPWPPLVAELPANPVADGATLYSPVRYRVLRPHARGGLGEVFVAEDTELHREVALKEIQRPHADDPHSRERFLLEAEVNGRLEHPGVVPVYGLGAYRDGRPFYAMRFIRGDSLKQAIDRFHAADAGRRDAGERALALRQLLGQFVAVCNAVAYAHSRGVLHRDLKPANVMLGKFGETLVVDWGLAKVLGREERPAGAESTLVPSTREGMATQAGAVMGTPAYMAPEQAAGKVDQLGPAADIYALGATLYHLLAGRPPLQGKGAAELLGKAVRGEWAPPRQVSRAVPAALDAVCRKAMALRPEDRYGSAQDLAADVERWLADEPVTAYREPLHQRLRRWVRRHPALTAGAAVLALAVAGGALWLAVEAAERDRYVLEALQEVERLEQRGGRWAEAKRELARARGRLGGGGPEQLRRRADQAEVDLNLVDELADIRLLPATLKVDRPDWRQADTAYAAAFRGYGVDAEAGDLEEAARRIAASAVREQLVLALDDWAVVKGKLKAPGKDRLLALAQLADRNEWGKRVRQAVRGKDRQALARLAAEPAAREQPAARAVALSIYLSEVGDLQGAVTVSRRALARDPGDFWLNWNLAQVLLLVPSTRPADATEYARAAAAIRPTATGAHLVLGNALMKQERYAEAEAAFRKAAELKPDSPEAHYNVGAALAMQGRRKEAEAEYRQALRLKPDFVEALAGLGGALNAQGRHKEGEALLGRALALDKKYAEARNHLGASLNRKGRYKEAETHLRQAIKDGRDLYDVHHNLAVALFNQGRVQEAEAEYRQVLQRKSDYAPALSGLGAIRFRQGQYAIAEAEFRKAVKLQPDLAEAHHNLAAALERQGRFKEAAEAYRQAVKLDPDNAQAHANLGGMLLRLGQPRDAEAACRRAIRLKPGLAVAHATLGNALLDQKRFGEAATAFRQAIKHGLNAPEILFNVGTALLNQGQAKDAEEVFRQVSKMRPDMVPAQSQLARALLAQGRTREAEAAVRQALRLAPGFVNGYTVLSEILLRQGQFAAAVDALRQGHELAKAIPRLRDMIAAQLREAERLLDLDRRLPAIQKGEALPRTEADLFALARFCKENKQLPAEAVRLYGAAFRLDPKRADDLAAGHRYTAAAAAALAAAGKGEDAAGLDAAQRASLRGQALAWLRADLGAWSERIAKGTAQERAAAVKTLRHWQADPDFAAVRGPGALGKLPEAERAQWQRVWDDVQALLEKAGGR